MIPDSLRTRLRQSGVLAVLVIDDRNSAVPLAQALLAGGVDCLELTLRTPAALESLSLIRREVPEMVVGAGTVLTPHQVQEVAEADAAFAVAPGLNPRVVQEARRIGLPFAPGVCTPSEIELALELGCRDLKFFPAEPMGGVNYWKTVAAPFAHLQVNYIPLGGIHPGNAASYLGEPAILALGGSWLASREQIAAGLWADITQRARQIRGIVDQLRGGQR